MLSANQFIEPCAGVMFQQHVWLHAKDTASPVLHIPDRNKPAVISILALRRLKQHLIQRIIAHFQEFISK
jgi:hypothetical protein